MGSVLLYGLGGLLVGFFIVWAFMRLRGHRATERRTPMLRLEVKADVIHRRIEGRDELLDLVGLEESPPKEKP